LTRASETTGHRQVHDSSSPFRFEIANRPDGSSPDRAGTRYRHHAVLLARSAARPDRTDKPAIRENWNSAFRGNRTGLVGETHESGIAGRELIREYLAGTPEQGRSTGFRDRETHRRVLGAVEFLEIDEVAARIDHCDCHAPAVLAGFRNRSGSRLLGLLVVDRRAVVRWRGRGRGLRLPGATAQES